MDEIRRFDSFGRKILAIKPICIGDGIRDSLFDVKALHKALQKFYILIRGNNDFLRICRYNEGFSLFEEKGFSLVVENTALTLEADVDSKRIPTLLFNGGRTVENDF